MLKSVVYNDVPMTSCKPPMFTCARIADTPNNPDNFSMHQEPHLLTASEATLLMRSGRMTVQHYISSLLKRYRARDRNLQAWVYLDEKDVMIQAEQLDEKLPEVRGPLHGVAVGIKDIVAVKGTDLTVHSFQNVITDFTRHTDVLWF